MTKIISPKSNIVTPNSSAGWKFEKYFLHDDLIIMREQTKKYIIGYVNKHPDGFWFWFFMNDVSYLISEEDGKFETSDDALENLASSFITFRMNALAEKTGIINDPNLVKK